MAQIRTFRRTCFLLATLILISISETGGASELYVQVGESIQSAVNEALPGDVILVGSGIFSESIYVNKNNLIIKSASGNPDDTIITGENRGSYVFEIVASDVQVSGFSITEGRCGIFLNNAEQCIISDNKISNHEAGIYLFKSSNNLLSSNMVYSNQDCGIKLLASPDNIIYGNYFNNKKNARDNKRNIWNENAGNYWSDYEGTDEDGDGIGDSAYIINPETGSMDNMPLMEYPPTPPVLPRARFTSDVVEGYAPLSVNFSNFSENATSILWDFGDGQTSSHSSPLHTYSSEGEYLVSLTASNRNDSDSANIIINVLNASEKAGPIHPKAKFISNATRGRVPLVVKFVDISENADSVMWIFGDGKTSCCSEPAHTFCYPGNYTVSLMAENENGTSSVCIVVTVLKADEEESISDDISNKVEGEGTGRARVIPGEKLESIKDSVISAASSKNPAETGLSLENGTLRVQKNIEGLVDDSLPGFKGDYLPEIGRRITPWVPSFLGLAGIVFMVSVLNRVRRSRK